MGFWGYRRADGSCGIRNHVVVMSSVSCANGVVEAIGRRLPAVKTVVHTEGCGRGLEDMAVSSRTLVGLGKNPNVAAVLIIGLGCEWIKAEDVARRVAEAGRPVEHLSIQDLGGTVRATAAGVEIAAAMVEEAKSMERVACSWAGLTVGLECGGSDALSGITANPLAGWVADWLVGQGGRVILSETTEMIGTQHILARRAASPEIAEQVVRLVDGQQKKTEELLGDLAGLVISPGNMDGGLSSIAEKSMGCIIKGGTSPLNEVVGYAEPPTRPGLVIMDTPGSDIFSLTGMAAGGAALFLFTTGRGSPVGFPIVPVIKIATNTGMFERLRDNMDINAGRLLDGATMDSLGTELKDLIRAVAGGAETKAEIHRQDCLAIYTAGPPF
jgi:altronate dehydratase large subunit